ncbi:MAG: biotin transporter BioY [Chloroflexi bacterium]|nr:biotin transporter BioY [Chloroflexota bacterium]
MHTTPFRRTRLDALLPRETLVRDVVLIVAGSALLALCAQVTIHLPIGPVPITGQTFAVLLIGAVLGPRLGTIAAALYVLEGIANLPVYASGAHGWGVIIGSSGGYLLSYPFAAFAVGFLARLGWDRRPVTLALAMLVGNVIIYVFGLPWLANWMYVNEATLGIEASAGLVMQWGLTPFIPGDLAKLLLAASLVPAGWLAVRAFEFGPEQALRGEGAPTALRLGSAAVVAGAALAISAFLPWRSGDLGITSAAGQVVLVAGIAATVGAWLLHRREISARLGHLWVFAAAALGGLLAFVNLVDFTEAGTLALADVSFGLPVAMVAALVLLAFLGSEGSAALIEADERSGDEAA